MMNKNKLKPVKKSIIEPINFYEKMPKKFIPKNENPYFDKHHITIPFRMVIAGGTGSMKTNTALDIIYNMPDTFYRVVIITKNKDEPLYKYD